LLVERPLVGAAIVEPPFAGLLRIPSGRSGARKEIPAKLVDALIAIRRLLRHAAKNDPVQILGKVRP
jgi:hypothetical protein